MKSRIYMLRIPEGHTLYGLRKRTLHLMQERYVSSYYMDGDTLYLRSVMPPEGLQKEYYSCFVGLHASLQDATEPMLMERHPDELTGWLRKERTETEPDMGLYYLPRDCFDSLSAMDSWIESHPEYACHRREMVDMVIHESHRRWDRLMG